MIILEKDCEPNNLWLNEVMRAEEKLLRSISRKDKNYIMFDENIYLFLALRMMEPLREKIQTYVSLNFIAFLESYFIIL